MLSLKMRKLREWVFVGTLVGINIGGIYSVYKKNNF